MGSRAKTTVQMTIHHDLTFASSVKTPVVIRGRDKERAVLICKLDELNEEVRFIASAPPGVVTEWVTFANPERLAVGGCVRETRVLDSPPGSPGPAARGRIKCAYCRSTFATQTSLNSHLKTHALNYQHRCFVCGRDWAFYNYKVYTKHMRSHHPTILMLEQRRRPRGRRPRGRQPRGRQPSPAHFQASELVHPCDDLSSVSSIVSECWSDDFDEQICCASPSCPTIEDEEEAMNHDEKHAREAGLCHNCDDMFPVLLNDIRREVNDDPEATFWCQICMEAFFTEQLLLDHKDAVHR